MKKFDAEDYMYAPIVYENIYGKGRRRLILQDGSVIPEKIVKKIPNYTFIDFVDEYYKDTYIEKLSTPHLICSGCATLEQLENIIYSNTLIQHLNNTGLIIYLYETCYYDFYPQKNISVMFTELSYSCIDKEILKPSLNGFENTNQFYCLEFESIQKFIISNNLKNVTVKVVDYNIDNLFKERYKFKIETEDICLVSMFKKTQGPCNSYEYDHDKKIDLSNIKFKFWSANSRYEGFRQIICSILYNKNSNISFRVNNKIFDTLENHLWFDLHGWKDFEFYNEMLDGIKSIEHEQKRSISDQDKKSDSLDTEHIPEESYNASCICIVNECKFAQPTANLSEKTLNAIKCFRPFILVAPPYTLKFLKHYGVQTFDNWWDESYDNEENHEARLIKIIRLINHIDKKFKDDQLTDLLKDMQPILEHNYRVISKIPQCVNNLI